jgi:putative two-component system response regulator
MKPWLSLDEQKQGLKAVGTPSSRILIVDDEEDHVRLLESILDSAGFQQYRNTTDSRQVLQLYASFQPDLLLLDLHMPYLDGFKVMEQLASEIPLCAYLPILVLTADINAEVKQKALSSGASDFLSKPWDAIEVILRIKNLLRTRQLNAELHKQNQTLEAKVQERTAQLAEAQLEILDRLATVAEYRDDNTGQHTQRVGKLAAMIAQGLGQSQDQVELLRLAAPLHDIGKIGLPDRVLMKEGKLTPEEFAIIKSHTNIGSEILQKSKFSLLQVAREIAASHHEKWDGSGYPQGLQGEHIPLSGRIVAIADVFDALTHARPYKKAWALDEALMEIQRQSGKHFDPHLIDVFMPIVRNEGLQNLVNYLQNYSDDRHGAVAKLPARVE